jgi:hypothetical protein
LGDKVGKDVGIQLDAFVFGEDRRIVVPNLFEQGFNPLLNPRRANQSMPLRGPCEELHFVVLALVVDLAEDEFQQLPEA